jgi:hypothetical protein
MVTEKVDMMVDAITKMKFGITATEAQRRGICIKCKLRLTFTDLGALQLKGDQAFGLCVMCSLQAQ